MQTIGVGGASGLFVMQLYMTSVFKHGQTDCSSAWGGVSVGAKEHCGPESTDVMGWSFCGC